MEPGQKLSHYRLVEKIGEGGMGVVWKARDEKLRRDVALKVLPAKLVEDPERRRRLLREARSAAAINHPNIATVHEVDEADGTVFIAMELVEGKTLRSLLGGKPLAIPEALRIATEIAEGLVAVPFDAGYGLCEQPPPVLATETATVTDLPGTGDARFFLVTARNRLAEEGTKGFDHAGVERGNPVPCP